MEYRLSKFKNDIANQFGHNVFYNNVLIRVFYYLLEERIYTRILFLMTKYRRSINARSIKICQFFDKLKITLAAGWLLVTKHCSDVMCSAKPESTAQQ